MSDSYCIKWPEGATAAASFCFDLDAESAVLSVAPQAASRMSVMSHQSYGPVTGVPRLLDMLEKHEVAATFFVPGLHRPPIPQRHTSNCRSGPRDCPPRLSARAPQRRRRGDRDSLPRTRYRSLARGCGDHSHWLPRPDVGAQLSLSGSVARTGLPLRLESDGRG